MLDPRKLSQLLPFLKVHGLSAKKSLSQNFLIDKNILEKIVLTAGIEPGEKVLEIGPGIGALTLTLLERGAEVLAVEKDRNLATLLPSILSYPKLQVIEADILKVEIKEGPFKVISNIPYHISADIVKFLASLGNECKDIYLLVQKEFAQKLVAKPRQDAYSSFSLFTQYHFTPTICFDVSPSCFYPKPAVTSSLVSLTPKENKSFGEGSNFIHFIDHCFQKRRKMLRSILDIPELESFLSSLGLPLTARPEELSLDHFVFLFALINP